MKANKFVVTGCDGFIGSWLCEALGATGTYHRETHNTKHLRAKGTKLVKCDMRMRSDVEKIVRHEPDTIFHMAAQSLVTRSWEDPEYTLITNALGTLHLLEAVRKSRSNATLVIACSSAEYGLARNGEIPIKEDTAFRPMSPYAVSKIAQDMLGYQYAKNYGLRVIRARLFNITGPRKVSDACSDFAKRVADVEKGRAEHLRVGNLEAVRDITDVRDCVKALALLAEKGKSDAYNICSGKGAKMKDVVDMLVSMSRSKIKVAQDAKLMRVSDEPVILGDNSKIRKLGYAPSISIKQTLGDMLDYWRSV